MNFDAVVGDWVRETKARQRAVFLDSTQTLFFDVLRPRAEGGQMRIDTGFLRASAQVSLDNPILRQEENPFSNPPEERGTVRVPFERGPIALTISGADAGNTIFMTFAANYARAREFGTRNSTGDMFVRSNTARWQDIVTASALKVRQSAARSSPL